MIRTSEVTPGLATSVDLEAFWLKEIEKAPDLSYRLAILLVYYDGYATRLGVVSSPKSILAPQIHRRRRIS